MIEILKSDPNIVPLLIKNKDGDLNIVPAKNSEVEIREGYKLVYLGKKLDPKEDRVETAVEGPESHLLG